MRSPWPALALLLAACATPPQNRCDIAVVDLESVDERPGVFDVSYRVGGKAGSRGVVSLAARRASGEYIAGRGVAVGPGPFVALVRQNLTGRPAALVVLLELPGARCKEDAELP